jgi:hypothetical protein
MSDRSAPWRARRATTVVAWIQHMRATHRERTPPSSAPSILTLPDEANPMITVLLRKSFPLAVFVLLASAAMPGCGEPSATVDEVCGKCTTDGKATQTCIKDTAADRDILIKIGCGTEFQDMLDCLRDEGKCLIGSKDDESACPSERIAVANCIGLF